MSHELRELIGIGTLGASKLKESNMAEARLKDDTAVGTGWKLLGIENMVDSVMASFDKLEEEMALESRYWDDISAIEQAGFRICRLPHEPQTLAVRFGFPESAPMFYEHCTGPLRRNEDGSARLVTGPIGRGFKRVRVAIETNGKVTGITALYKQPPDDAPIQRRVIEARNTASNQELWHEINREARMLLPAGVSVGEDSVTWDMGRRSKAIITLEDQGDADNCPELPQNLLAESILKALFALKLNVHAQNYKRRTYPQPPAANRTNPFPEYALLRPLIAHAKHLNAFKELAAFLDQLVHLLHRAGVTTASSTYTRPDFANAQKAIGSLAAPTPRLLEFLASQIFQNKNLVFEVNMSPEVRVQIQGATYYVPHVFHRFAISMPNRPQNQNQPQPQRQSQNGPNPSGVVDASANGSNATTGTGSNTKQDPQQQQQQSRTPSFLESAYPPPTEAYSDYYPIMSYLQNAAKRVFAAHLAESAQRRLVDQMRDDDDENIGAISWTESMHGPAITMDGHPERDVWVSVAFVSKDDHDRDHDHDQEQEDLPRRGRLSLCLHTRWLGLSSRGSRRRDLERRPIAGGGIRTRTARSWTWRPYGGGERASPEDVCFRILMGEMPM